VRPNKEHREKSIECHEEGGGKAESRRDLVRSDQPRRTSARSRTRPEAEAPERRFALADADMISRDPASFETARVISSLRQSRYPGERRGDFQVMYQPAGKASQHAADKPNAFRGL